MYKIRLSPYAKIFYTEWLINPKSFRYNLVIDQVLYGDLDVNRLKIALKSYIAEHVVLNSHIQEINGEPHWVKNEQILELEYLDHPINSEELFSYVSKGFDLYQGPLYRFKLIKVEDRKYRFVVVMQHLLIDGSAALDGGVFEAISNYYNYEAYKEKYSLEEQIKLITDLENRLFNNLEQNKDEYKNFWHQKLLDIDNIDLTFLKLYEDKNRKDVNTGSIKFNFEDAESFKLEQVKLKYGITPYVYSQSIFAFLLHRYTSLEQLAISYPISIKEGLDFVYGTQINTNFIPYQFNKTTTIVDLFKQSRSFFRLITKENIKYSYYPITHLIKETNDTELLNISFAQTFFRDKPFNFIGIKQVETLDDLSLDWVTKNSLLFEQNPRDNKLNYRLIYDKNSFDGKLLNNFVGTYKRLFVEILNELLEGKENKQISSYHLLDDKQYHQIVYEWNQTEKPYPKDKTIHQLFEEQVAKTPDNIAVVFEDKKFTYQELNYKANQLAHYLLNTYSVGSDDLIVLCLDRSELMIVAILGVLKAGGAYVPIEPNYPDERIKYILSDTNTRIIITNIIYKEKLKKIIGKQKSTDILFLESKKIQDSKNNINPITATKSNNLIYVIYTSGTTGNPKGVMIEHSSVANYITYLINYNKLGNQSIGSQYSAFGFDAVVTEIYPIILSGGVLCIISEQDKFDPKEINEFFYKNKITRAFLPTKFSERFFDLKNKNLKRLLVAGEKLETFDKQSYQVDNGYGPTEATVHTTNFLIDKSYDNIPIGKPINNVKCYIVDGNLNIMPVGAIGELMIGGESLARGYLNRPDLTQEKFISNPFQTSEEKIQNKNSRLYKTGDLVRILPDGNIEYVGRSDFQVKIRGYRIELGEIENKLLNYPNIKQAVATARERASEQSSDKYLIAYYVADKKIDDEKLKDYLTTQLPAYMIPQILIPINQLPLTANGKIDKKALPEPKLTNQSEYIAPRSDLEKNICALYAQVLNLPLEQIGITSDFFKMGGDSISCIQLVYRIKQKLALNISVTDVFTHRNVEQLIKNVLTNQNIQNHINKIKREDNPIGKSELLPIQDWFFDNIKDGFYKKYDHWNQSFIIKTPELDSEILKLSIEKLLQQHDAFRFRFKNFEQSYIELDLAEESGNIKDINISNLTDTEIKNKLIEVQSNFNIETGPIYVIAYLHGYKDKTARLFFAMHHLIIDSVSWRMLTHDIAKLYELLQDKRNVNKTSQELLGPKGTSYRQWAEEIKNYKPNQQELTYWDDVLKDYNYISRDDDKESFYEFLLSSQDTKKLLTTVSRAYDTQINDILLAVLSRTLAQIFNRQINHVTLEGHGREEINQEIDVTKTMGWFTTMYPVRLVNQIAFPDLIETTKEILKNIPNKGMGYGAIKSYKNLPNITFNYLGQISNKEDFWTIVDHIISVDPQNRNNNILDMHGYVVNGKLKFHISYNNSLKFNAAAFAGTFKANLEELMDHCADSHEILEEEYKSINKDMQFCEISSFFNQLKLSYIKKSKKKKPDEQLQHKIDCYLKTSNNLPQDIYSRKSITNVLLTGGTGFLGCNLLNQLLKLTDYNVFLLIRADSQKSAIDKINKKFQFYFDKTLEDVYEKRIFIFKADLVDNNLGLSEAEYNELSSKIDSIIHAAALVKHYGDYENFYLQNVQSTINLLEFTKLTKLKDFHYVSTRSILDKRQVPSDLICTEDDIPSDAKQDNVYLKTKIQGEYQATKYRNYGVKSNIYRVGTLAFIAENLRMQENREEQGFLNWVKCLFELRCVAKEISKVEVSPADLTAKAIIKLFDKTSLSNKTYHVFNPHLFDLTETENSAYKLETLDIDKFIDRIVNEMKLGINDNLLMKFLLYQGWMDNYYTKNISTIKILQDRTQYILKYLDFVWTQESIQTFFNKYYQLLNKA